MSREGAYSVIGITAGQQNGLMAPITKLMEVLA